MAPVSVKEIIKFSSEDPRFPAQNLLKDQKWMTDIRDISETAMIELQLEKVSKIHYIDIGYNNISALEITVGRSSWPSSREYCTVLPTVMLQSPAEARTGKNKVGCRMFKCPDHLNSEYVNEHWDRVRLKLIQQFSKKKQMGIEFIRIGCSRNVTEKLQDISVPVSENSLKAPDYWKDSQILKLVDKNEEKLQELNSLQAKLLRICGTTEEGSSDQKTLSRTAKIVLNSRCESLSLQKSPQSSRSLATKKNRSFTPEVKKIRKIVEKPIKRHSLGSLSNPLRDCGDILSSDEDGESILSHIRTTKHENNTSLVDTKWSILSNKNDEMNFLSDKTSTSGKDRNSYAKHITDSEAVIPKHQSSCGLVTTGQTSNSLHTFKSTESIVLNSSSTKCPKHDDQANDTLPETINKSDLDGSTISKTEIKRLKRLITKYFNSFNMEDVDPDNISLEELIMTFQAMNNVQLDTDGRDYFSNTATNFFELARTMRKHKGLSEVKSSELLSGAPVTPSRKRKSKDYSTSSVSKRHNSPAKILRRSLESGQSSDGEVIEVQTKNQDVQCPICMKNFSSSVISEHAAFCGEEDSPGANNLQVDNDLVFVSATSSQRTQRFPGETVMDLSDNLILSEDEKRYWENFRRKPKPYHPRLHDKSYSNCKLMKCPSCGQYYKSSEIEEHGNECAEMVFANVEKRGLQFVDKTTGKIVRKV